MESANLLDSSLYCCQRCKGLFTGSDDKLKHQINCMGNPMESSCTYFACERKIFLQLFQPDDFLLDGCDPPFLFSKDDSFINHFVKIRIPDIFDPSIFLKTASAFQPNQGDAEDTNFLIESNIDTLEEEAEKANGSTYADPSKKVDPISGDRIQSIINKNIEYLKHDDIPSLSSGRNKVDSSFSSSQSFPQLLSPIDKHLHLFGDGSKSRLQSPFERGSGLLHDGQLGYSAGNFMYSSNPSLPFSCGLSTDLFSSIPPSQEENQQTLPTNIEEFPTLKYLDLAKKDPFFGQNPGLSQINNAKDPFLINAAFKTTERQSFGLQKSQITRSCEDLQSSPTLPIQDGNYFNFPSTLDEPTQLDYLDLATLDFITNPNLISFPPINFKEKMYDKDQDIYSEDNITCHEPSSIKSEVLVRLGNSSLSDHGGTDGLSAFSRVKKKKTLRLKKSKSDMEQRYENIMPQNRNNVTLYPSVKHSDLMRNMPENYKNGEYLFENTDVRKCRKRRSDSPKGSKSESKLMKMNRKPEKHLNVREKLTHLTEEQKDKVKAVLGQTGCIFVKKKRSLSCDEPVVYVNDSQVFGSTGLFREHSGERDIKFHPIKSNSKVIFDEQCKTRKLTSVLHLKCQECDFQCRSVIELKNHRAKHLKKSEENIIDEQPIKPSQVAVIPNLVPVHQHITEKDKEEINEQRMAYQLEASCHLEKIPELPVVDEQANLKLYEADASNTFTTSLSIPFISENCQQNICENSIIGEAMKDVDHSSRKTLNSLPISMTNVPMTFPKAEKINVPVLSQPSSSLYLNTDLNQETEMAVKTIENISSEYDKCNLNEEEISPEFSEYVAVKIVLEDKFETNDVHGPDIGHVYDKSGLDVLNINPLEHDINDKQQSLTDEIETYSVLTTVPLFQDEQTYSAKHNTEIYKAIDKIFTESGNRDTEDTNKVFEDLLENGRENDLSGVTNTDNNVTEQAFNVKDNTAGVKMDIGNKISGNEDETIETKHVGNTLDNDLTDFNSTSNSNFENLEVLEEPSIENLQDLVQPRVENLQNVVESREKNINGPKTSMLLTDNMNKIYDDIKGSDVILENAKRKERHIEENGNNVKHNDVTENTFPIQSVNSFESVDRNHAENVVFLKHSNNIEKFSQDVSDPDVGIYLDKLVDLVSSDNFECTKEHQQDDLLKNIKPASEFNTTTLCDFSAETNGGHSVIIYDKTSDILELNNIAKEAIKEPFEFVNDQTSGYVHVMEKLTNGSVIKDSGNISGHTLLQNVVIASEIKQDFCNENKCGRPQYSGCSGDDKSILSASFAANKSDSNELLAVDISNGSTNLPIKVESTHECINEPLTVESSPGNLNIPKVSISNNDSRSVPATITFNNDCIINKQETNITREIDRKTPEEGDVILSESNIPVTIYAIDKCNEVKVDAVGDNDRNVQVIVDTQNAAEMRCQFSNNDGQTSNSKNEDDDNASKNLKIHELDMLTKESNAIVDQNKKVVVKQEHTSPNPLSKLVQGKGYKKQVKERDGYFLCDVTGCQFKTQYRSNVAAHYQHVHLAIKKYMCDQCVYSTPNKSSLRHHMQLNHLKEKKFKCPDCDYLSLFHSDIVKHVRHTHMKQKQYACNQCEYRTGHSHSLKLHIMSHNGIRPYKCSSCEYRANNANKVTRHIKLCHGNEVGVSCIKEDLTFEIDAKQFQCEEIISYQDIKVIELTTEEADVIMKQREVKKEQEKEAKVMKKKAEEAEKKAKREMKRKEEEIANMSALNAIEMFSNVNSISTKDIKVITLTPETARAFMAAKVTEKSTVTNTDGLGETNRFTKIMQKPKQMVHQNVKGSSLIKHDVENSNKKVS